MVSGPRRHLNSLLSTLFLFLVGSRLWDLAQKPYHHDEGIYSTLSWRFSRGLDYRFDPMTHGPFLFTFQGLLFKLLPPTDFTGRLPVAIAGILLPFAALVLLRNRASQTMLTWFVLCIFSPTLCYFSRFLGMDALLLVQASAFLAFGLLWWDTKKDTYLYLAAACLGFLFCTKLNWLFYLFSFGTFLLLSGDYRYVAQALASRKKAFFTAVGIVVFVFCLLYSTLFTHLPGIWDGLFGKMIPYWMAQNKMQRIAGPFHFYLTLIAIYELPLVLGMILIFKNLLFDARIRKGFVLAGAGMLISWLICRAQWGALEPTFHHYLHMNLPWHPSLLMLEIFLGAACLRYHLARQEKLEAFFAYWAFTSLVLYSYAGEKIPWLLPHMVLPAYLYLATLIKPFSQRWKYACCAIIVAWQGFNVIRSSFWYPADPRERFVYTHTTQDYKNLIDRIDRQREIDPTLTVQVVGNCDAVWPSAWYMRKYDAWFRPQIAPEEMPNILITNWDQAEALKAQLMAPYTIERIPLRAWWIPDPAQYGFKNFLNYYFTRHTFNVTGSTDVAALIRQDTFQRGE